MNRIIWLQLPHIRTTLIINIASYQYSKFVGRGTTYNTPHAYTGPVLIVNSRRPQVYSILTMQRKHNN